VEKSSLRTSQPLYGGLVREMPERVIARICMVLRHDEHQIAQFFSD
jgi:hypothetical protein